jgi:hypothetical protein
MLTPRLEDMIWQGKASFKTFVAGGSEKSILKLQANTYIIIIDITYFPRSVDDDLDRYTTSWALQQLTIQSQRCQNILLFRNDSQMVYNGVPGGISPYGNGKSTTLNTYFIHNTDTTFSFTDAETFQSVTSSTTPVQGTAFSMPLDYGKDGLDGGAIANIQTAGFRTGEVIDFSGIQNTTFQGLKFPVTTVYGVSTYPTPFPANIPLAIISYVEIAGQVDSKLR